MTTATYIVSITESLCVCVCVFAVLAYTKHVSRSNTHSYKLNKTASRFSISPHITLSKLPMLYPQ